MQHPNNQIQIAIVSDSNNSPSGITPFLDDQDLAEVLINKGAAVQILDWRSSSADWKEFDSIFISSTWDIPINAEAFLEWVSYCNADKKRTINDGDLIIDNIIKSRYLTRLLDKFGNRINSGNAITPSCFVALKSSSENYTQAIGKRNLSSLLKEMEEKDPQNWLDRDIVIKPIVSADGNNTFLIKRSAGFEPTNDFIITSLKTAEAVFQEQLSNAPTGIMIQPYIPAVEEGEYCLVFFNNKYSHAIQKMGGFRNHSIPQRKYIPEEKLPAGMVKFAADIISHMQQLYHPHALTRTRIDFLSSGNQIVLCELECTEPNTNLQSLPPAVKKEVLENYASALMEQTEKLII